RARAEFDPFVAQEKESRDDRYAKPRPDGYAGPARKADRRVKVQQRESQYNQQIEKPHGGSLPRTAIMVLTNLPDRDSADALARALIEARLAACVSIGAVHDSLYHWRGQIEMASELLLTIKTCADLYPAVEAAIRARHPYELPEIVTVPIDHGFT